MGSLACRGGEVKAKLVNSTYGLQALKDLLTAIEGTGFVKNTDSLVQIREYVDSLETRLSAARAGYLDNLNNSKLLTMPHESLFWGTDSIIVAGTTVYLYAMCRNWGGGKTATETEVYARILIARTGNLKNLNVMCDVAPGASQSFIYTVRINGVATAMTVTISGASQLRGTYTGAAVAVAVGDYVTVQVVASATAQTTNHSASVDFQA